MNQKTGLALLILALCSCMNMKTELRGDYYEKSTYFQEICSWRFGDKKSLILHDCYGFKYNGRWKMISRNRIKIISEFNSIDGNFEIELKDNQNTIILNKNDTILILQKPFSNLFR